MAYMNQTKKAAIAAELKKVVPAGWKWSLSVEHHMTIRMTIKEAPVDLLRCFGESDYFKHDSATHLDVNPYRFRDWIIDDEVRDVFVMIFNALNLGNWDRSDLMTDYHDVGHYVSLHIGRWNKPFVCTAELEAA